MSIMYHIYIYAITTHASVYRIIAFTIVVPGGVGFRVTLQGVCYILCFWFKMLWYFWPLSLRRTDSVCSGPAYCTFTTREFRIRSAGHLIDPGIYTKFFKKSQYLIKTLYTLGWQVCTKVFIQLVIVYTHRSSSSNNRLYDTFRRWPVINYTFLWADQLFFYCTFEHYNMPYFYHN